LEKFKGEDRRMQEKSNPEWVDKILKINKEKEQKLPSDSDDKTKDR